MSNAVTRYAVDRMCESYALTELLSGCTTVRTVGGVRSVDSRVRDRIARNEIYARHGRRFRDSSLQSYFNNCSWYSGTIAPDSFNESVLNAYEKANVQTIKKYEQAHGYL